MGNRCCSSKLFAWINDNPMLTIVTIMCTCVLALGFALIAEHSFAVRPCELCFYQRYILVGILLICSAMLTFFTRVGFATFLKVVATMLIMGGLGLSVYHVGVEQHWWKGPERCSLINQKQTNSKASIADQLAALNASIQQTKDPLVRCDEVNWRIFGVSATIWTIVLYVFLGLLSVISWLSFKKSV